MIQLEWAFLGRIGYGRGLDLQAAWAGRVARGAGPRLLMMEHPPTITLGRSAEPADLLLPEPALVERGYQVFRVARGGRVTCHGPGQLVGYPVAHLDAAGCSVPEWVRGHAEAIIDCLAELGVRGRWSDVHPGVWVGREKIAAVGFALSRRISTHGFALNLDPDLSLYAPIVACGLPRLGVTSVARLIGRAPAMAEVASRLALLIARRFGWSWRPPLPASRVCDQPGEAARLANSTPG